MPMSMTKNETQLQGRVEVGNKSSCCIIMIYRIYSYENIHTVAPSNISMRDKKKTTQANRRKKNTENNFS